MRVVSLRGALVISLLRLMLRMWKMDDRCLFLVCWATYVQCSVTRYFTRGGLRLATRQSSSRLRLLTIPFYDSIR